MEMHKMPEPKKAEKRMVADMESMPFAREIHFSSKELPEIEDWKVGKKYRIVMEVEQTSMSTGEYGSHAGFKVLSIGGEALKEKPAKYSRRKE